MTRPFSRQKPVCGTHNVDSITFAHFLLAALGLDFPKDFVPNVVKPIFRHLFRVLAHMYHAHFDSIVALGCEAHLNTIFAHFWCFGTAFDLLDKKEAEGLKDLAESDAAFAAMMN